MGLKELKKEARIKRKKRIRKKVFGTEERPRLTVFRSAKHIYAQAIDDGSGRTIAQASSLETAINEKCQTGDEAENEAKVSKKVFMSMTVGKTVADRLMEKGIQKAVFDRNGYMYHGRVKAVSDGAREAGLDF